MGMIIEEQLGVMEAFRNGKTIQFRKHGDENWEDTNTPLWNFAEYDYRVKTFNSETRVLDVTNIKQFFEEYKGDKVADANNILDQILFVLTSNSYEHIIEWLNNHTDELQNNGYIKESNITKDYMQECQEDVYSEIQNDIDVDNLDSDIIERAAAKWMNSASCESIIEMIKNEA